MIIETGRSLYPYSHTSAQAVPPQSTAPCSKGSCLPGRSHAFGVRLYCSSRWRVHSSTLSP